MACCFTLDILSALDHCLAVVPPMAMLVRLWSHLRFVLSSCSKYCVAGEIVPQLSPMIRMRGVVAVLLPAAADEAADAISRQASVREHIYAVKSSRRVVVARKNANC